VALIHPRRYGLRVRLPERKMVKALRVFAIVMAVASIIATLVISHRQLAARDSHFVQ
jgi:hypothetical protein